MAPKYYILCFIAIGILYILFNKFREKQLDRVLVSRGWTALPTCPVREPWPGQNYGPIRCFRGEIKPGVPCTALIAMYRRPIEGTPGRTHTIDYYLGIYLPKEVRMKPEAWAAYRARVAAKPSLTDPIEHAHTPAEGGMILVWRNRPSISYLDDRLREVAAVLE